jgi:hypothetical protein
MDNRNRQWRLRRHPEGRATPDDFELIESEIPAPGPGEALVRNLYLSLDPSNRIWITDGPSYLPPVELGEVMRGGAVSRVVASNDPHFKVGDLCFGLTGWQDYALVSKKGPLAARVLPKGIPAPPSAFLGVLGATGLTAYFGMLEIGEPKAGQTVVVSAAAGAVGSIAGQLAKMQDCRVVGIVGSRDKADWIVEELGFDAAVVHKEDDWKDQLKRACPKGIDVDFENVGGEIMDTVMARMNLHGRVVLCGLISGYNSGERMRGNFDTILMKRLRVEGFIVLDYLPRAAPAVMRLGMWLMEGKLTHHETVVDGLEHAPAALDQLFTGQNLGKLVVRIADTP